MGPMLTLLEEVLDVLEVLEELVDPQLHVEPPVGPPERDEVLAADVEVDFPVADLVVVFLVVLVAFFVFEVATQSAQGSCWGSVGAGP